MIHLLKNHYHLSSSTTHYVPVAVAAVRLDYNFYLFQANDIGYVVVETDYLSGLPGVLHEIEGTFDVKGIGWCVRRERRPNEQGALLSLDADDYDPDGTNDTNHNNYQDAVYSQDGLSYAVLKVKYLNAKSN